MILRQSTAVDILIGPFLDLTDAATAETGESPTVKLSKNGQALATKNDVTTPTHDADGMYNCEFDATDTNTVGTLVVSVAASATALPVRHEFQIVEEAVYDAMYASSAAGPLQSTTAGRTLDVTAGGTAGVDWANVEAPTSTVGLTNTTIGTTTTNTDMVSEPPTAAAVADAVWDEDATAHQTQGSFGQAIGDPGADADTIWSLVNSNLDAAVSTRSTVAATDIVSSGAITTSGGVVGAVATVTGDVTVGSINANVVTASALATDAVNEIADGVWDENIVSAHGTANTSGLIVSQLTHRALATGWSTDIVANSALDQLADDGTATYDRTTDSLQAIADSGGGGPTAAQIADAVWDEAQADHVAAGSFGVTASEIASILDDTGTSGVVLASTATSAQLVDDIWDEDVDTTHQTAGTAGKKLDDAGAAADPWSTALPGAYGAGTAGKIVGDNLDAAVSTRSTVAATDIVSSGAITTSSGAVSTVTTLTGHTAQTGDSFARLGAPAGASVSADIAAAKADTAAILTDTGTAGVVIASGQTVDTVTTLTQLTTAQTESYAADGATASVVQLLYQIWSLLGERSISGTTLTAKKLDGSTTSMTFTLDDGTTPTSQTRAT